MMVFLIAMVKRIAADHKGQEDHTHFKFRIMNNIDPE